MAKIGRNDPCLCGSGKKYKRCCLQIERHPKAIHQPKHPDPFFRVITGEVFQPVRLYYEVQDAEALRKSFDRLNCMKQDTQPDRWVWLYYDESRSLAFKKPYHLIPKQLHPITLGMLQFHPDDQLSMNFQSVERALHAMIFFDQYIDRQITKVTHTAILNKVFGIDNNPVESLNLEELFSRNDLVFINPEQEMEQLQVKMEVIENIEERRQYFDRYMEAKTRKPLPELEGFPIHFYEDGIKSPESALHMRQILAMHHWMGRMHYTLKDVLMDAFRESDRLTALRDSLD